MARTREAQDTAEATDEATEASTEQAEAPAAEANGEGKPKRAMPEYGAQAVDPDSIPDDLIGGPGRTGVFLGLLKPVVENPGQWFRLAHYKTPTGAKMALKGLTGAVRTGGKNKGEAYPQYDKPEPPAGHSYEFRAVRVPNPDNPGSTKAADRHSELFGRVVPA